MREIIAFVAQGLVIASVIMMCMFITDWARTRFRKKRWYLRIAVMNGDVHTFRCLNYEHGETWLKLLAQELEKGPHLWIRSEIYEQVAVVKTEEIVGLSLYAA